MASFSNRVLTTTQDTIVPKVIDQILSDNFITTRFISNGKKWTGETLKFPVKVTKSTLGSPFSGLDTLSAVIDDNQILLSYDLRAYSIPVAVAGLERVVNASDAQVIDLVKNQMESKANDMLDGIGSLFYGDGTGTSNKAFNGLDNLNDDGTTAANVGNQSRSTYTVLKGTRTASGGTLTLTKMTSVFFGIAAGSNEKQSPTVIQTDESTWGLYESLLQPTVQATYQTSGYPMVTRNSKGVIAAGNQGANAGFRAVTFKGIPMVADEKAPAGTMWMNNENYLMWYGIKDPQMQQVPEGGVVEGVYTDIPGANSGLQFTGMMKPTNQYGEVGHIMLLGNLVTNQPRRMGRLTGITGV